MALLETNVGTGGQQILKATDPSTLFRQRSNAAPQPRAQAVATPPTVVKPMAAAATPVQKQAPVQQQTKAPLRPPKVATAASAVPAPELGEQYKYEAPVTKRGGGVLDKNYYEDLGFSTSKERAEELRGTFKDIDLEAKATRDAIKTFSGKTETARVNLQERVDNAWAEVATSTVTLGPTTWEVPRDVAISLRESLASNFPSSDLVPAGDLTLEQYKVKYQNDIARHAGGVGTIVSMGGHFDDLYAEVPPEGTRSYDQYMREKAQHEATKAAAQQKFDEAAPKIYEQAKALNDKDNLNFTFDYKTSSKNRAKYYAILNQVNPQIAEMKQKYTSTFTKEAQKTFDILDERTLEAQQSELKLKGQLEGVESQRAGVAGKQEADRAGMAETFNTLFRQRGK